MKKPREQFSLAVLNDRPKLIKCFTALLRTLSSLLAERTRKCFSSLKSVTIHFCVGISCLNFYDFIKEFKLLELIFGL